eukprot:1342973-Prymnesium_polylepis.2
MRTRALCVDLPGRGAASAGIAAAQAQDSVDHNVVYDERVVERRARCAEEETVEAESPQLTSRVHTTPEQFLHCTTIFAKTWRRFFNPMADGRCCRQR